MSAPSILLPSTTARRLSATPFSQPFHTNRVQRQCTCASTSNMQRELPPAHLSRRSAAAILAAVPMLLLSPKAKALIPDDDDEELIEKAKANRKTRLQTEKVAEKEYAKSGGFADSEVVAVQVAVNKLAKSGEALAAGDLPAVAATVGSDAWVGEFQRASTGLSTNDEAKRSANAIFQDLEGVRLAQGIGDLESSAKSGSLQEAKKSFVTAVSALQTWAESAGIAASLKGL